MELDLKQIYLEFMEEQIDPRDFNIVSFRQNSKKEYDDHVFYQQNLFYPQQTHNPFEIKHVRDKLIQLLQK